MAAPGRVDLLRRISGFRAVAGTRRGDDVRVAGIADVGKVAGATLA